MKAQKLHDDFGVEIAVEDRDLAAVAERIRQLVSTERLVRVKGLDLDEAAQLRLASMLGPTMGRRMGLTARLVPHVRYETGDDRYAGRWHADQSWSVTDTWSMLYCVSAEADADRTQFIDTATGLRRLDQQLMQTCVGVTVLHDVANSRRVRPAPGAAEVGHRRDIHAVVRRVRRSLASIRGSASVVEPTQASRLGTRHRLIDQCPTTGASHLRVGDHAWLLSDRTEAESTAQLAQIHAELEDEARVLSMQWGRGDLVVYDNRMVLHRRDVAGEAAGRVLRRTLVASGPKVVGPADADADADADANVNRRRRAWRS